MRPQALRETPRLEPGLAVLLDRLVRLRAGESLLVYTDAGGDRGLVAGVESAARARGASCEILDLADCPDPEQAAVRLHEKIGAGSFDAVVELTGRYYYETRAWRDATRNGSRIYSVGGLDESSFQRCIGDVDPDLLQRFGRRLEALFRAARRIRITTAAGTDLHCEMNRHRWSRALDRLRSRSRSQVWAPSGQPVSAGEATFLGGQLAFVGRGATLAGRVVVDGYQWPPDGVGPLAESIELDVRAGRVIALRGAASAARALESWLPPGPWPVLHLCLGFNPGAVMDKDLCEAERVAGALTLGFSDHPFHTDGVMRAVSLDLDGRRLLSAGRFVHPELDDLPERLGLC